MSQFSNQQPQNSSLNSNLFVNYLPPSVGDDLLRQLFSPYGEIDSCKVMLDLETGQSRCFGFVKFKSISEAEQAVLSLNGYRLDNKTLVVKFANTATVSSVNRGIPSSNIYVKGIPIGVTDEYLVQLFSGFGTIIETKVLMDPMTNYSRGMGFVRFSSVEEAENAIEALNGQVVAGSMKPLIVKFADTEDERKIRKSRQQVRMGVNRFSPYGGMSPMTPGFPAYPPNQMYNYGKFGNQPINPMMHGHGGVMPGMNGHSNGQERNLFIYHLPGEANEALLYKLFSPYGAIESVKVATDPQTNTCKGYGFVKMVNIMDAWNAIQMLNGAKVGDKYIQVSLKKPKH